MFEEKTFFEVECPKLSCITTFFNESELIGNCINSVLSQSYQNFELIVVDDGSTDHTASYVDNFSDPRIIRIRQANDGLSSARNRGIAHATGDYICFLDADDTRPPWAFNCIVKKIQQTFADVLFCRGVLREIRGQVKPFYDASFFDFAAERWPAEYIPANLSQIEIDELFSLAHLLEPQAANKVVRTEFLRQHGLHFPNTHFFEDMFFHAICLMQAKRIDFIQEECFTYYRRYSKKQITSGNGAVRFDALAVAKMTLEMFSRSPRFASPLQRAALLAATMRIVSWCELSVAHNYRYYFNQTLRAALRMIDSAYQSIPEHLPNFFDEVLPHLAYAKRNFDI